MDRLALGPFANTTLYREKHMANYMMDSLCYTGSVLLYGQGNSGSDKPPQAMCRLRQARRERDVCDGPITAPCQ